MRMLVISNMYPSPERPSFGVFVRNFVEDAERRGVSTQAVVLQNPGQRISKSLNYLAFFVRVWRAVFARQYDFIYVHYISHSLLPLAFLGNSLRTPLIINVHGSDLEGRSQWTRVLHRLVRSSVERATLVVVPSLFFKNKFERRFINKNVLVSPSGGVDLQLFRPHNRNNKYCTFMLAARIERGKGWRVFTSAIMLFKQRNPKAKFRVLVAGGGGELQVLTEWVEKQELEHQIRLMGECSQKQLSQLFGMADMLVFPTLLEESLGLVGLEAMATGMPVAASRVGAIPEYVIPGQTGFLFPPGDSVSLADFLQEVYYNRDKICEQFCGNCILTAQQYDASLVGDKLWQNIEKLVG